MASLNRAEFIGNLGADPEVRRLQSGDPVVSLRLAVTDTWRDKSTGERKERTEWVPVTIFNENIAKVAESYLRKGSKVFVSGSWQTRKWTDQSGQDRYTTECVLQKFRGELVLLDGAAGALAQRQETKPQQQSFGGGFASDLDDEVPFAPEWR